MYTDHPDSLLTFESNNLFVWDCGGSNFMYMSLSQSACFSNLSKSKAGNVTSLRSTYWWHLKAGCMHPPLFFAAKVHEKALKLHAIASLHVIFSNDKSENHNSLKEQDQNCNGSMANGQVMSGDSHRNFSQQTTVTTVSDSPVEQDSMYSNSGTLNRGYQADDKEGVGNQGNGQTVRAEQVSKYPCIYV